LRKCLPTLTAETLPEALARGFTHLHNTLALPSHEIE